MEPSETYNVHMRPSWTYAQPIRAPLPFGPPLMYGTCCSTSMQVELRPAVDRLLVSHGPWLDDSHSRSSKDRPSEWVCPEARGWQGRTACPTRRHGAHMSHTRQSARRGKRKQNKHVACLGQAKHPMSGANRHEPNYPIARNVLQTGGSLDQYGQMDASRPNSSMPSG
jgi:hypothetical protein